MARRLLLLAGLALLGGCAHRPASRVAAVHRSDLFDDARPAAASLVFAPPVGSDIGPQDLDRGARQQTAFLGYEEGVAEFFYLRWDDRQSNWGGGGWGWGSGGSGDRYERRAVSEKVGVLYR